VIGKTDVKPTKAGAEGPAAGVSFDEALGFCDMLNKHYAAQHPLAGYAFRLPTEAEWEYACRAGTTTPTYVAAGLTTKDANFDKSVGNKTVVGSYPPNPWGLYDLFGNTAEWVLDENGPYGAQPAVDPVCWSGSGLRLLRGGSDFSPPSQMRAADRRPTKPDGLGGLRVVYGPVLAK
jgi:formylglycine-generating enzyme required for sulfatase activity